MFAPFFPGLGSPPKTLPSATQPGIRPGYSGDMPVSLLRRRDFVTGIAIAALAARTPKLFAGEKVDKRAFGVRRIWRPAASGISFPAIAAASMPEILVIGDSSRGIPMRGHADLGNSLARAGYLEFRRYRLHCEEDRIHAQELFIRAGIEPLLIGDSGDFLFSFETLASREKAWREIIPQPESMALRAQLLELAIYEVPKQS